MINQKRRRYYIFFIKKKENMRKYEKKMDNIKITKKYQKNIKKI